MCQELRAEVSPRAGKIQVSERTHQTAISKGVLRVNLDMLMNTLIVITSLLMSCTHTCNEVVLCYAPPPPPHFQYLGDTTLPVVKDRIKELLFSWKVGLPNEPKINDAFLMLKREGTKLQELTKLFQQKDKFVHFVCLC